MKKLKEWITDPGMIFLAIYLGSFIVYAIRVRS